MDSFHYGLTRLQLADISKTNLELKFSELHTSTSKKNKSAVLYSDDIDQNENQ